MQTSGEHIARWLRKRRMTQAALASRTGLSPKHINLVIHGAASLSPKSAVLIERELGVSARVLLRAEVDQSLARLRVGDRGFEAS